MGLSTRIETPSIYAINIDVTSILITHASGVPLVAARGRLPHQRQADLAHSGPPVVPTLKPKAQREPCLDLGEPCLDLGSREKKRK